MSTGDTLVIFTRFPEPGKVKTRLIPVLGGQGAADLLAEMTRHILSVADRLAKTDGIAIEVHFDGGSPELMQAAFGNGHRYIPQQGRDLGERMLASFTRCLNGNSGNVVLIGTDCPGITETVLRQAFARLGKKDCILGPSKDGGYHLIGLYRPIPGLFEGIPWGTGRVFERTMDAGNRLGLQMDETGKLRDIDRPEDIPIWKERIRAVSRTMISVIIPALNEDDHVGATLEGILRGENIETILVDGGSRDRTRNTAAMKGARVFSSRPGRGIQMNAGAAQALGDILFFLHADSLVPAGYDKEIRGVLTRKGIIAGAFSLEFDHDSAPMRIIAAGGNARARYFGLPYGDQGLFIRKKDFLTVGGFPETPIMEDVLFIRKLKAMGCIAVSRSRIITSSRRYRKIGPLKTWILNQFAMAAFSSHVPLDDISALYRRRETSLHTWFSLWKKVKRPGEGRNG